MGLLVLKLNQFQANRDKLIILEQGVASPKPQGQGTWSFVQL